jgi:hypothetical protein
MPIKSTVKLMYWINLTFLREEQPTVCLSDHHKGGRDYATLYTDLDGFVYRGSLKKDPAIEWIKKMRFR